MRNFTVLLVCVLVLGAAAMAQVEPAPLEVPKSEFYIGYAFQHADTSGSNIVNSTNLNGFAFEFSHYLKNMNLGLTFDIGRTTNSRVDSTGIKYTRTSYMIGPTYRIHRIGFFTANVHALGGIDRDNFDKPEVGTVIYYKNTDPAAAAGVTFDGNLSRHLGIRVAQIDYVYTHHNNTNQGSFRYTGGVVVRF
jgi:opacity protein-like surface antigen